MAEHWSSLREERKEEIFFCSIVLKFAETEVYELKWQQARRFEREKWNLVEKKRGKKNTIIPITVIIGRHNEALEIYSAVTPGTKWW